MWPTHFDEAFDRMINGEGYEYIGSTTKYCKCYECGDAMPLSEIKQHYKSQKCLQRKLDNLKAHLFKLNSGICSSCKKPLYKEPGEYKMDYCVNPTCKMFMEVQ